MTDIFLFASHEASYDMQLLLPEPRTSSSMASSTWTWATWAGLEFARAHRGRERQLALAATTNHLNDGLFRPEPDSMPGGDTNKAPEFTQCLSYGNPYHRQMQGRLIALPWLWTPVQGRTFRLDLLFYWLYWRRSAHNTGIAYRYRLGRIVGRIGLYPIYITLGEI